MMAREPGSAVVKDVLTMWPTELVELYRREYPSLVRLAYGMLGRRAEAEEVVQDAVVHLRDHWSAAQNPGGYLRRSVVNGCIAVLRRRDVAERLAPDPPPADAPNRLVELRDVMLQLPDRQRAAIVMRHLAGMDDADIADALGVRRATVRSLVARGLAAMHRELDDD
jgi:RNA polymerase sigma factor (sigma-70 family)